MTNMTRIIQKPGFVFLVGCILLSTGVLLDLSVEKIATGEAGSLLFIGVGLSLLVTGIRKGVI